MIFGQLKNISWEILFLKNLAQNVVGKLIPDPFMKNQNLVYLYRGIATYFKWRGEIE